MPTALWPPDLPQDQNIGFGAQSPENRAVFQPDTGPAIYRRRSTFEQRFLNFQIDMNGEEVALLEAFWETLAHGTLPFTMVHPVSGTDTLWQFRRKFQIQNWLGAVAQGAKTTYDRRQYTVVIELERLGDAPES